MLRLHYSNRLDALIDPLADAIARAQRNDPLAPVQIIVPNRVVERFIKFRVAEQIGVAANLRFPFLRSFLRRLIEEAEPELRIVEGDQLQIVIFEVLRATIGGGDGGMKPAADYIRAGAGTPADLETRAIQLSGRIASLFREYSISREAVLDAWRRGVAAPFAGSDETGQWQRELWRAIFDEHRCLRSQFVATPGDHWMMLPDAITVADPRRLGEAGRGTIHIFGLAYVGTAFARIFRRLAQVMDVEIYALNPCLEFWEDLDTSRRAVRNDWARRGVRLGAALDNSDDPFKLQDADTLALQYWGRPGREYIRLLNELTDCEFEPHFVEASEDSLLHRVQNDILLRSAQSEPVATGVGMRDDASIRFLACPSVPREVEIVANRIWSLVKRDDRGLRFHEIAVMIPELSRDLYLPHIEAVFQRLHDLPIDIVSRSYASRSRVAEAIELMLDLPLGRFSRDQMLRLMTHPAIARRGVESGSEQWPAWTRALGVYLGADDADLGNTYIRGLYHWDQALKRLALGIFMEERAGDERLFEAGESARLLPLDLPQDEIENVARMARVARGLIADAIRMRSERMPLQEWSRFLIEFIAAYVPLGDADDESVRARCLAAIESIAHHELATGPVSYEVARILARDQIATAEGEEARLSGHGVAVGSLAVLQSLPFKVIFLLGLGEGIFPERERRDPLDLRGARRMAGDVSPADRDRYLFLQTILAARERLVLSYASRDAQTGDLLEPSSAIREFREILRSYVDAETLKTLTIDHRVSKHDEKYFPELAGAIEDRPTVEGESFDSAARRGARMAALRRDLIAHCAGASLPARGATVLSRFDPELSAALRAQLRLIELPTPAAAAGTAPDELRIPISALRQFLECPLQGAARYALGMKEDESEEAAEDEPLEIPRMDNTVLMREVFWAARGDFAFAAREYERAFSIAQMQGRAPAGSFGAAAQTRDLALLARWREQLACEGLDISRDWEEIRLGPADEFARPSTILDPLVIEAQATRPDGARVTQRVRLYGRLGRFSRARDASFQGTLRKDSKSRDFVAMALGAIVLAAAGEPMPSEFRAITLCGGVDKASNSLKPSVRELPLPSQEDARTYLATLVSDLLSGENFYFFPIEAAEMCLKEPKKGAPPRDLQQTVVDIRDNDFGSCASDYGPIRNARRFEPPDDEQIRQILARRYVPIAAIFETGRRRK